MSDLIRVADDLTRESGVSRLERGSFTPGAALRLPGSNLSRVDGADPNRLVAPEVAGIESQDPKDVVGEHEGDQPCVVDLDA